MGKVIVVAVVAVVAVAAGVVVEKYNCNIPWAILMDPTSACNLKCTGCWAAEYGNHMNLTYEEMNDIVNQGVELGTYVYLFTGGEPLVRKRILFGYVKPIRTAYFQHLRMEH